MSESKDEMSAEEYRRHVQSPRSMHKYGAKPVTYKGVWYASTAEARRASELGFLLGRGEILGWSRQPKFILGIPENTYQPDFMVIGKNKHIWVEDVKGVQTRLFKHNKKLWKSYGCVPLHILTARPIGWDIVIVEPASRQEEPESTTTPDEPQESQGQ